VKTSLGQVQERRGGGGGGIELSKIFAKMKNIEV